MLIWIIIFFKNITVLSNEAISNTGASHFAGKRSDSDIEIISNPSESSIEVIEAPNR